MGDGSIHSAGSSERDGGVTNLLAASSRLAYAVVIYNFPTDASSKLAVLILARRALPCSRTSFYRACSLV